MPPENSQNPNPPQAQSPVTPPITEKAPLTLDDLYDHQTTILRSVRETQAQVASISDNLFWLGMVMIVVGGLVFLQTRNVLPSQ